MTTERRFAAFSKKAAPPRMNEIPDAGLCLSAFIILSRAGHPEEVVLGHLNTEADWEHIGALDCERAERNSKGWMLPSSHLLLEESPKEAARRILTEQLGLEDQQLNGPVVFSEATSTGKVWDVTPYKHWDIEFIFRGERNEVMPHPAWRELRFVDLSQTTMDEMARYHEDILAHVGLWKSRS